MSMELVNPIGSTPKALHSANSALVRMGKAKIQPNFIAKIGANFFQYGFIVFSRKLNQLSCLSFNIKCRRSAMILTKLKNDLPS